MSERITAAAALVKCLESEGVTVVYGYPGAAICPFYDELSRSQIRHVLVRHEANAGHAASGTARISGKPGVCAATSGPGALNLIPAIAAAYMDSIPLVAITGQVCADQIGKDVFQEADITGAAEPFVKHSYLVKDAKQLPEIVRNAFYIAASGRPGPVLLDIPMDVQLSEISFNLREYAAKRPDIRGYKPSVKGNTLQIKRVAEAVAESRKPLICAGGGIFANGGKPARELLMKFAERTGIPVINTMMGISAFDQSHPLYIGMPGMHGHAAANLALNECDLLILLGARINDRASLAMRERELKVVHVDIDPAEIGKNLPATVPVVGDVCSVLEQLCRHNLPESGFAEWLESLREKPQNQEQQPSGESGGKINPKAFIKILNRLIPPDAVIVADVGQNQIWTANNIELGNRGRFMTSGGMGTMGYSVPAAIGAKNAAPEREVVAICGDGSFQMQFMELATAVQHGIAVKIIVMQNNRLGMVREVQSARYSGNLTAVFLDGSPDFVKIAAAYGIEGETLTEPRNADKALIALLASKKPYLLVVRVDENERSVL